MNHTLLSTKLLIPKPRKGYILRKGLFQRLEDLTDTRLTIIKGTPGSGKTTLLTSYIESSTLDVRWITLDSECNHTVLFWDYVVAALSGLLGASADDFAVFLQADAGQNIYEALKVLINSMNDLEDIVLVLDDFHQLDNDELLKSLEYFLANIPSGLHVVLLTRVKPAIYLAGFEIHGELLYIDEQELYLSNDESIAFLKETLSLSLPDAVLQELAERAEGWIGGLQLLAASQTANLLTGNIFPAISGSLLSDYITAEIFDCLSPEEQDFLLLTSPPSYFCQTVAEYLLPGMNFDHIMMSLFSKNLMIQCVDEQKGWFQYHNLFRDFLLERFLELEPDLQTQIYRKLARVFHELGDSSESLNHIFALKDYKLAMDHILKLPASAAYYSYMDKVPVNEAVQNFDFAFQKFFYHYYIYDYSTCTSLYQKAIQYQADDIRYRAFRGAPLMYGGESLAYSGDVISIDQVYNLDMYPLTRALVLTKNSAFLFHQDRYTAALEAVNESMSAENDNANTYIHYFNLTLKTQICEEMGQLRRALAVQGQTRRLIENNKMLRHLHMPTFAVTIAGLYMKQMRLEEAWQVLQDNKTAINERGGHLQLVYNYNCIEYLFLTKKVDEAVSMLDELIATEAYKDILSVSSLLKHLFRAGAMSPSMQDQFLLACEERPKEDRPMNSRLLHAYIYSARGERQKALSELDDILQIARKQESSLKIVEATLQRLAIMVGYSRDLRHLTDLYKEALYYACENKICMPFVMEADTVSAFHHQHIENILPELSKQEIEFHNDIVKLCVTKENCVLSEREQEIITALAEGLSNSEIAQRLYISLPTVKTHLSNIFRKLKVKSRLAALEKVREMGLV